VITLVHYRGEGAAALLGALHRLGFAFQEAADPGKAAAVGPVILAGSGPLEPACASLKASGWWRELPQLAADGRAVLGLNLGLHLLAEGSEECPRGAGLGLIPGIVRRLGPGVKVPHRGWSQVRPLRTHPGLPELRGWLFFAHSHALEPTSETLSAVEYGRPFSALECRGRTVAAQAQLERSGSCGLAFLQRTLLNLGERAVTPRPDCN
jgi:imidazole glycerol phosphate synthase glutamine amidotransferase subunit